MTEFEKQRNKGCDIIVDCSGMLCDNCKIIQAAIWRAALRWVLKTYQGNREPCGFTILNTTV